MRSFLLAFVLVTTAAHVASADKAAPADKKKAPDTKAPAPKGDAPAEKSLFDRLGGKDAIQKVVHQFVQNAGADKVINKRFAKTDLKKLEGNLVDQVCEATGGPCKYKGKSMADGHKGMKITEAEWDATVADLKAALDKFKVGDAEQKDLLGALAGMKGDIVGK